MFLVYRDRQLIGTSLGTADDAAELIEREPGNVSHSSLCYEIVDVSDTPEGIVVSRIALLKSTSGWLLIGLPADDSDPAYEHHGDDSDVFEPDEDAPPSPSGS